MCNQYNMRGRRFYKFILRIQIFYCALFGVKLHLRGNLRRMVLLQKRVVSSIIGNFTTFELFLISRFRIKKRTNF